MTKISGIATTETSFASVASIEGERGDGTSVQVPYSVLRAPRGALAYRSTNLTAQNWTSGWNAVALDAETYDTDSVHSTVTNTSRLTVPSGVTRVQLVGQLCLTNITADNYANAAILKNGTPAYAGGAIQTAEAGTTTIRMNVHSPVLTVTSGDYFEIGANVDPGDTSVDALANQTWLEMRIIY